MLHIALVDDEPILLCGLEKKFAVFLKEFYPTVKTTFLKYSSGESLLSDIPNHKFDLVVLDYQMPNLNGYETAVKLRAVDENLTIVFFTNYSEHWQQGFKVNAFRYLLKSDTKENLSSELRDIMESILNKNKKIPFKKEKGTVYLSPDQIVWLETNKRYTNMHLLNYKQEILTVHEGINEVCDKLRNYGFVRTHNSYSVNLGYAAEVEKNEGMLYLQLSTGESISVARDRKREVISQLTAFMGGDL